MNLKFTRPALAAGIASVLFLFSACNSGGGPGACGDGQCVPNESPISCPADCFCGNGTCDLYESKDVCPNDCAECGDGRCEGDENEQSCPQDCVMVCVNSPCDFWPQCGCPAGEKCTYDHLVVGPDETCEIMCLPAGTDLHGQPCNLEVACAEGTTCVGIDGDYFCRQYCVNDADCPGGDGSKCYLMLHTDADLFYAEARVCTLSCNPVTNTGCPADRSCLIRIGRDDVLLTDCFPAGTLTAGQPCDEQQSQFCQPGLFCNNNQCAEYCRVDGNDCPAGEQCYAFSPPPVFDGVTYGACF